MLAAPYRQKLVEKPVQWLVTGVAGFVGSHVLEELLKHGQLVVGLDNFSTGNASNLDDVRKKVGAAAYANFTLIEGDIRELSSCKEAVQGCTYVLHQAALASVPLSLENPLLTHEVNEKGFVNLMTAAHEAGVRRLVFASSCAIYGDNDNLPLSESERPQPISPYAASKAGNEIYAQAFLRSYGFEAIGLRYFNIFGERQDPNGAYAAVIPRWISAGIAGDKVFVDGDGLQSRDFIYVKNVALANIAVALSESPKPAGVLNIASGQRISLKQLLADIEAELEQQGLLKKKLDVMFRDARRGDIKHSGGTSTRMTALEAFNQIALADGLRATAKWYADRLGFANQQGVFESVRPIESSI